MIEASLYDTPTGGYAADIADDRENINGPPSHSCYQTTVDRNVRHGVRTATAITAYNTSCRHWHVCSRSDELRTGNYAARDESTTVCYDVAPNIEKNNIRALEVDRTVLALAGYPSFGQPCNNYSMLAMY